MNKSYRTHGDIARELVQQHDMLYFVDVEDDIHNRLTRTTTTVRAAFALACAEGLMRQHEKLPPEEQRPFTLSWRTVLNAMWAGLAGNDPDATRRVQDALQAFHASPYDQPGLSRETHAADEDAAAGSIYAAECYVSGDIQKAMWAAGRAIDAAFKVVDAEQLLSPEDYVADPKLEPVRLARDTMHPAVQAELRRQLAVVLELERHGVTVDVLNRLRSEVA